MNRLDWLVTFRIGTRIGAVVLVFFGLICLTESLDSWRFQFLTQTQGQSAAILAIVANAARWSIKVLPVTVLLGGIIALLDLQGHRELMVIKAGGVSIWRIMRAPLIALIFASLAVSLFADARITEINRAIMPAQQTTTPAIGGKNQVWLEQQSTTVNYVLQGTRVGNAVDDLVDATFFMPPGGQYSRIEAQTAKLQFGEWTLTNATLIASNRRPDTRASYAVATTSSRAELELRLASTDDFTFFELSSALASGLTDPVARAAAAMRFAKLLALPALLVGSLLIAFAFTAGYRRTGSYGGAILYGVVLGFVVFVITEMADRAGSAGVLDPTFAAWGPAIVAIVIGVTVLLHKEDGRA